MAARVAIISVRLGKIAPRGGSNWAIALSDFATR
jgi:hypothetical protein